jgi:hypothetical protein
MTEEKVTQKREELTKEECEAYDKVVTAVKDLKKVVLKNSHIFNIIERFEIRANDGEPIESNYIVYGSESDCISGYDLLKSYIDDTVKETENIVNVGLED